MKMRTKNLVALLIALLIVLSTATTYASETEEIIYTNEFDEASWIFDASAMPDQLNNEITAHPPNHESISESTLYFTVDENEELGFKAMLADGLEDDESDGPIITLFWTDLAGVFPSLNFGSGRYQANGTIVAKKNTTQIKATVTAYKYNTGTSRWDYLNSSSQSGTGQVATSCSGPVSSGLYKVVVSGTCGVDSFSGYAERSY